MALENKLAETQRELSERTRAVDDADERRKTVEFRLEKLTELANNLNEKVSGKNQKLKDLRNEVRELRLQTGKQKSELHPEDAGRIEAEAQQRYVESTLTDGVVNTMEEADAKAAAKKAGAEHYQRGAKKVSVVVDKHYVPREGSDDEFFIDSEESNQPQTIDQYLHDGPGGAVAGASGGVDNEDILGGIADQLPVFPAL